MRKRSMITLYSGDQDLYSHQVRIALAEKDITLNIIEVDEEHPCEDLLELNPYNTLPTLVDRDLVLYQSQIIMEYLDERFPHPPLLPVYPVARAKCRLMIHRIQQDWYSQLNIIMNGTTIEQEQARAELTSMLLNLSPVFDNTDYFLSNDFTLVDCHIAPFFWQLPHWGIHFPHSATAILDYQERLFQRTAFQKSLTEKEKQLRESE